MRNLLKHWTDLLLGWLGVTSDTGGWDRWIAFLLVLLFVVLFDFACRLVIVRGVRRLVARTRAVWDDTLFSVRVLRCACHILSAVLLAVVLYVLITLVPDEWPVLLRLAAGTALVVVYAAYTVWRDMPLAGLPVIGKHFRKR